MLIHTHLLKDLKQNNKNKDIFKWKSMNKEKVLIDI